MSVVLLRQGFVIPNPVDLHFGSALTRLDGGPSYGAIADPVDPGFAKRAGGVAATVGIPVAIPDWPLGVELDTGGEGGANRPVSASSPDGTVSIDAIPARAVASQGPGNRVDADAAVESVRIGTPGNGAKPAELSQSVEPPEKALTSAILRATRVLRGLAARSGRPIEKDSDAQGSLLSLATASAKSGSGWVGERLEAVAAAQVSAIELLGGTIRFDAVRSTAVVRTGLDGTPSDETSIAVVGAQVADIPITVDAGGVHVDKQAVGGDAAKDLQQALSSALNQAGVRIGLVESKESPGTDRAVGLEVVVRLANEQFRENNELAFRLATVEASSSLNPESVVAAIGEPARADSGAAQEKVETAKTDSAGTMTGPQISDPISMIESDTPHSQPSSDETASGSMGTRDQAASESLISFPGVQVASSPGASAQDHRQVELVQSAAADHSANKEHPLSKGEASVLLIGLAGQAAFVVLVILRRSFSG